MPPHYYATSYSNAGPWRLGPAPCFCFRVRVHRAAAHNTACPVRLTVHTALLYCLTVLLLLARYEYEEHPGVCRAIEHIAETFLTGGPAGAAGGQQEGDAAAAAAAGEGGESSAQAAHHQGNDGDAPPAAAAAAMVAGAASGAAPKFRPPPAAAQHKSGSSSAAAAWLKGDKS